MTETTGQRKRPLGSTAGLSPSMGGVRVSQTPLTLSMQLGLGAGLGLWFLVPAIKSTQAFEPSVGRPS